MKDAADVIREAIREAEFRGYERAIKGNYIDDYLRRRCSSRDYRPLPAQDASQIAGRGDAMNNASAIRDAMGSAVFPKLHGSRLLNPIDSPTEVVLAPFLYAINGDLFQLVHAANLLCCISSGVNDQPQMTLRRPRAPLRASVPLLE